MKKKRRDPSKKVRIAPKTAPGSKLCTVFACHQTYGNTQIFPSSCWLLVVVDTLKEKKKKKNGGRSYSSRYARYAEFPQER
jgi:hypothetical protein